VPTAPPPTIWLAQRSGVEDVRWPFSFPRRPQPLRRSEFPPPPGTLTAAALHHAARDAAASLPPPGLRRREMVQVVRGILPQPVVHQPTSIRRPDPGDRVVPIALLEIHGPRGVEYGQTGGEEQIAGPSAGVTPGCV